MFFFVENEFLFEKNAELPEELVVNNFRNFFKIIF